MSKLKTIIEPTTATVVEKKSKFIANLFHVISKEEAENKIKELQKNYYDARHNCFAYIVNEKEGIIEKSSDDGEPSGTAGAPILNLLKKNELQNVLVVVTRYFGGILLGTGGLVRAYSEATTNAIEIAEFAIEEMGEELSITLSYSEFDYFQYYCQKKNIRIINTEYAEYIFCRIEVSLEEKKKILSQINEKALKVQNVETVKEKYIRKKLEK